MSLGIVFKGTEGVVLAADSRVTLTRVIPDPNDPKTKQLLPATFDNATKLLNVPGQPYVGAVTFGLGALGQGEPRTAASFLPEFDKELNGEKRLTVEAFAQRLSDFYVRQWTALMPKGVVTDNMVFLVGGYDDGSPYGRVFDFAIPGKPKPSEGLRPGLCAAAGGQ